jgi:glycosyltransferase involved in cell wall biosynthesis
MDVSLIITTYNWPTALNLTLASAARQTVMPSEIIVADDGSGPQTRELVSAWTDKLCCRLLHIWQENCGYRIARSRNGAIAVSSGEYVVLIDGDMVLHPKFIEDHAACARPDCFIQGARPRISQQLTERLLATGSTDVSLFSPGMEHRAYGLRSVLLSRLTSRIKGTLGGIQGCNQSFWRGHAVRVNGFDERFGAWGPEDREFAARLLHIGVQRNYVRHRAIAYHLYHPSRAPAGDNPLDRLLEDTLRRRATWCEQGLSAHRSAYVGASAAGFDDAP